MMKEPFNVGDTVFYLNYLEKTIESRIIERVEERHGHQCYWMRGYFGYFDEGIIFKTHQEAQDKLNTFKKESHGFKDR